MGMTPGRPNDRSFWVFIVCLVGILLLLFWNSFDPRLVIFSNDGPLGAQSQRAIAMPDALRGVWQDLNYIGLNGGGSSPTISSALLWLLGPLYTSTFYVPLVLLFLGLCAWRFFRRLGLAPVACILGGLAAVLNANFFSTAAWGVGPQVVCFGLNFLALAACVAPAPRRRWVKFMLAGFAVGMGVMEGADNGVLFSLLVAAFVMFQALAEDAPLSRKIPLGILRLSLVSLCAVFIAAHTINVLVGIAIKGVAGTAQDARTKQERWDPDTQWSLTKRETLRLIIPGLFGFRTDTPKDMGMFQDDFVGGNYWGAAGRDAAWDRYFAGGRRGPPPDPNTQFIRFGGGGDYAGVLVVLVGLWAAVQSFRKDSVFPLPQRKLLWFWAGTAIVTLLLAYGRYAPFYRLLYALPYFSAIRNPAKFLHLFSFAIVILFAFGIHGLNRKYLEAALVNVRGGLNGRLKNWWAGAAAPDKRWVMGCLLAVGVSLAGWLIYASSRHSLEQYLLTVQFDEAMARQIAGFSIRQVGWFILTLAVSVLLLPSILIGALSGHRARWAAILLGLVLVADMARANLPWIIYWNYKQKYASNPVVDLLREKPFEHRVALLPFTTPPELSLLNQLYRLEWAQHHFLYYNIQSLDIIQMPRVPQDVATFESALHSGGRPEIAYLRRWALTNTRYLLGPTGFLDALNSQLDPALRRFRIATSFNIVPKPGIPDPTRLEELTAERSARGAYALFEFTGALPRAALYSNWETPQNNPAALAALSKSRLSPDQAGALEQIGTNDFLTLEELASPSFDPSQTVLVAPPVPAPINTVALPGSAGTVEFTSYAPTDIQLHAVANTPSILLLNDKYDPVWQVSVDGRKAELLRCNYIMRGVYLQPGSHSVEFFFKPDLTLLYVSSAAIIVAIFTLGFAFFSTKRNLSTPPPKR